MRRRGLGRPTSGRGFPAAAWGGGYAGAGSRRSLPAASQRPVNRHQVRGDGGGVCGERELILLEAALGIEHVNKVGHSTGITLACQIESVATFLHGGSE